MLDEFEIASQPVFHVLSQAGIEECAAIEQEAVAAMAQPR